MEWKKVFILNLNVGSFPSKISLKEGNIEEEERLFYVAVTRAIEDLYLLYDENKFSPEDKDINFIKKIEYNNANVDLFVFN
ncbi:3'-5' exonuclease [Oceanotoga teriensis]|uniref:3'-5' exonuclease n=1 Tax=Oceanotoga teriensis TaxID=515440 RepID=UPI0027130E10|nr:3'-5' exonuclease [Oceanotoga teriensis]MDO7976744.1 hypothetical protein [Oceanotoga teriensis]